MRPGQDGSSRWHWAGPSLVLFLLSGCAHIPGLDRALLADRTPAAHRSDLTSRYVVHCPDVLSFQIDNKPEWHGERAIGSDGRVWLDAETTLRVDGQTVPEITQEAARYLHLAPESVQIRVAGFNSQQLYLLGEVNGLQQVVPYQGPETIVDLLQRVGGLTGGAAPRDIQVVRAHVADGKTPETFRVDLADIILRHNQESNLTLEPFDKIYIGQTPQSKVSKCLPPWLRTLYESFWDMRQAKKSETSFSGEHSASAHGTLAAKQLYPAAISAAVPVGGTPE